MRRVMIIVMAGAALAVAGAGTATAGVAAGPARAGVRTRAAMAGVPAGLPADVPAAASTAPPRLPEPSAAAWPFPADFPQTSGIGRLAGGAALWSDFIYDDYGATNPGALPNAAFAGSSGLAPRQGGYAFPAGPADNNGADIFRAGVGLKGGNSYWRVDWVTLADPAVPLAEWTFDTDNNAATGASAWPASAGVSSPGIEKALVVSSRGAWLIDTVTGARTNVADLGGALTIDPTAKSFIVRIPTSALPVSGTWRVRLGAGLADPSGQSFAAPDVPASGTGGLLSGAERLYNITFRSQAQEPPVYTDGMTDGLVAAAQAALAANPVGAALGADGATRMITGNFWMEDDQADTLAGGDVSKFSETIDWSALAAAQTTPEPAPTGYSARWYVSRLHPGAGQISDDGPEGNFKPTLLEQVQPYAVYVPTGETPGARMPLTWILHSLEVNYNQYGGYDPQLLAQLCQARHSICATTEGFGPAGWYYNEAETDFWQVWRSLADAYPLDPERTVISGYSMGGWASYKLAFEHPDDFAGALSLDGPVVCGVEVYPGASGAASSGDPGCAQDGQSAPLVANARWIPYVIDQTYADELVPTTGVIAQAQAFDALGQRYDLFIHTGADHLGFAVEDRFSDVVTALGNPVRATDPGRFTYRWYPSLDSARLGIGATGDYWLSGLSARSASPGTIATVTAVDAARPDPAVTVQRSGPSPVSQPLPGTETRLSWALGARPRPRPQMTLTLTDVSALTVDAAAARLRLGVIDVDGDGPARLGLTGLAAGTVVTVDGTRAGTAGRDGRFTAATHAGRTVIVLTRGSTAAAAHRFACAQPTGRLTARRLGPVRLGATRAATRREFSRGSTRGRRTMDFFCPARHGIRVGYRRGRVVLVLTASRHYALRGVRPGTRLSRVARRLRLGRPYGVGRNTWYLVADGRGRGVLKVRHGMIQEIGIATASLVRTRAAARRFLRSFP